MGNVVARPRQTTGQTVAFRRSWRSRVRASGEAVGECRQPSCSWELAAAVVSVSAAEAKPAPARQPRTCSLRDGSAKQGRPRLLRRACPGDIAILPYLYLQRRASAPRCPQQQERTAASRPARTATGAHRRRSPRGLRSLRCRAHEHGLALTDASAGPPASPRGSDSSPPRPTPPSRFVQT